MKPTLLFSVLALIVTPVASFAAKADGPKARTMAQFDANKDGKLDGGEVAAIRKAFANDRNGDLKRFDTDGDGKLSDAEIALMAPGSGNREKGEANAKKTGNEKSGGNKAGGGKSKGSANP